MTPAPRPEDELVFLPLGGSNEIGMNFNLYGYGPPHARKWIVVDLGVTFGDQTTPGVEIILPDPEFIEEYARDIVGIVLTHAHEDHIGAVAWLWPRLKAPLYATPFTAFLLICGAWVFVAGYTSINAIVKAELFPTNVRALGVGLPYAITVSLFGGTAPAIALYFKSLGHESWFYYYLSGMIFISLLIYTTMRDTKHASAMHRHE